MLNDHYQMTLDVYSSAMNLQTVLLRLQMARGVNMTEDDRRAFGNACVLAGQTAEWISTIIAAEDERAELGLEGRKAGMRLRDDEPDDTLDDDEEADSAS